MMKRILIIEDEFIIANQIKSFLESENYEILGPVDTFSFAIGIIDSKMPDLIIADIRLYDDFDAGIRISNYVSSKYYIPVIFLSGYSDSDTITKAKNTNPNTFLIKPKPLDKKQLLATVKFALPDITQNNKLKVTSFKGKLLSLEDKSTIQTSYLNNPIITKYFDYEEILLFESFNHFFKNTILIRTSKSSHGFLIRFELDEIERQLPPFFSRIHKSYIANLNQITAHKLPNQIFIEKFSLPVSEKYKHIVSKYLAP